MDPLGSGVDEAFRGDLDRGLTRPRGGMYEKHEGGSGVMTFHKALHLDVRRVVYGIYMGVSENRAP